MPPWNNSGGLTMDGAMRLDPNFHEFIASLRAHDARFLIVGGYAVAFHGHPRYTGDLDVWVAAEGDNADAVMAALEDFGLGGLGVDREDLMVPARVIQLGYPPLRIDLITSIDGVDFEGAFQRRVEVEIDGLSLPFLSLDDLRVNKRASARPQDLADIAALED